MIKGKKSIAPDIITSKTKTIQQSNVKKDKTTK